MPLTETFTDESAIGTPGVLNYGSNEFLVGGDFEGFVSLKLEDPNGDYKTIFTTDKPVSDVLFFVTETTRNYRIDGDRIVGEAVAFAGGGATAVSQVEAEAGTEDAIRSWSPLRIWQAIAAWAGTATSLFKGRLQNYSETLYSTTTTGDVTIDLANGNIQRFILDAARQFTMPADPGACVKSFTLILECATFTPTWAADPALEWLTSDGAAPTLVTTANLVNVLTFMWDDVDSRWLGFLAGKETA